MVIWLLIAFMGALAVGQAHVLLAGHEARHRLPVMVIAFVAIFYIGWWDTPAARCERGDLGACIVAGVRSG